MPLWGNLDNATGNQKPLFANTSNVYSNSTINGTAASGNKYYGKMMGVSATEQGAVTKHGAHAGWTSQKIGTGPIKSLAISGAGTGINAAGFLLFTDTSVLGTGANVNVSFTIANTQNVLQAFSTNPAWNGVNSVSIVSTGDGWSNSSQITVKTNGANTTLPTFSITLGGRGDRVNYETIVAMGSITGDDPRDNAFFSGV